MRAEVDSVSSMRAVHEQESAGDRRQCGVRDALGSGEVTPAG